jgi:hypothetical protein
MRGGPSPGLRPPSPRFEAVKESLFSVFELGVSLHDDGDRHSAPLSCLTA